jgi:lipopolysaccharide transport system ATP-binding protein
MKPIIRIVNVGKEYRIGARQEAFTNLREAVTAGLRAPFKRLRRNGLGAAETFWALKDVSFEVSPGEVLGIIGRNGAGKSTLLKILSRITEPTTGRAEIYGRIGSLLEVGTGFHPELTGRENIFLNGAMLGMKRREISRKFDEIVAFAEIDRFLDTPVKHYSSGMYMRLAFAVAAHLEPEILLVDEVLAVGDAAFQKKCLGKMGEVAKEGRTVLFVSHNMAAVESLCSRVVWLDSGRVKDDGPPNQVVLNYLKTTFTTLGHRVWDDPADAPGTERVRLRRATVRPAHGSPLDPISVRTPFVIEFEFWNLAPGAHLNLSLVVAKDEGLRLFNTVPLMEPVWHGKPFPVGLFRSTCYVPGDLMNDGTHRVHLYVVEGESVVTFSVEDILVFDILDAAELRSVWFGKWSGSVRPMLEWRTEMLEEGLGA